MTRRIVTVVLIGLMLGAVAWSADQDREQLRDGTGDGAPDQQQLRDGSCQTEAIALDTPLRDRDQLRDGTGDGAPDKGRTQDRARDGSCA